LQVSGDAADEASLIKAGIQRAKGLSVALATDTNNVLLVLYEAAIMPNDIVIAVGELKNLQ
jgi:voltage-gated potassium channel Kch